MPVYPYNLVGGGFRWFFIVDVPKGEDGKRRQIKRGGFATETDATDAETQFLSTYGKVERHADGTLAAELEEWLSDRMLDVEVETYDNYRYLFRSYVIPYLGDRQIYTIDKNTLHGLYKRLLASGKKSGEPLSPTTVRTLHRVLGKALSDLGFALDGVRQPRPAEREEMGRKGIWTPEEAARFLRHHADSRLRAAWALAVVLGLRRGEIAGLKWPRVHLDRGIVQIHWQRIATSSSGVIEKTPKGKSKRTIAIGPALAKELLLHQERQEIEKADFGVLYNDGGYVFCREDGLLYYPSYFTQKWEKACKEAGVPVIALHDGRHTSATTGDPLLLGPRHPPQSPGIRWWSACVRWASDPRACSHRPISDSVRHRTLWSGHAHPAGLAGWLRPARYETVSRG
ncbi:integrase [Catenuloplanes nepalensis]|uniref:Integrase n=1 Tax=Catenuloplanes nepalensis TaxID=587533 RepID=A0ABT9MRU9_9ACTN|nr:site-specific integrase [Catenuloplanes nepalensis]MDP9794113.1 integrase [Catenuloplanes nepalensis]